MHAMVHIAQSWATQSENRFMVFLLLFGILGGLVVLGTSAYHTWLDWELRRRWQRRSSEQEPR